MLLRAVAGEPVSDIVLPEEPRLVVRASTARRGAIARLPPR